MGNQTGTISYLRKMAERCRRAARESRTDQEAHDLVRAASGAWPSASGPR
jgi:hypothetical protein